MKSQKLYMCAYSVEQIKHLCENRYLHKFILKKTEQIHFGEKNNKWRLALSSRYQYIFDRAKIV